MRSVEYPRSAASMRDRRNKIVARLEEQKRLLVIRRICALKRLEHSSARRLVEFHRTSLCNDATHRCDGSEKPN